MVGTARVFVVDACGQKLDRAKRRALAGEGDEGRGGRARGLGRLCPEDEPRCWWLLIVFVRRLRHPRLPHHIRINPVPN